VELAKSSGFKALDSAAEQLVRKVVQELAGQLTPGRATELRIPVVYELTES
jgi:TonB family protein